MNYGELKASCARLMIRTDLTNDWPEFIRRAHDVIADQVALVAPLTLENAQAALPADFSSAVALWVYGAPVGFQVDGATIRGAIGHSASHPAFLIYRPSKAFFADDDATNTVLTNYPWVYRYGTLAEAGRFTRDADIAAQNEAAFREEISRINQASVQVAAGSLSPRPGKPTP